MTDIAPVPKPLNAPALDCRECGGRVVPVSAATPDAWRCLGCGLPMPLAAVVRVLIDRLHDRDGKRKMARAALAAATWERDGCFGGRACSCSACSSEGQRDLALANTKTEEDSP